MRPTEAPAKSSRSALAAWISALAAACVLPYVPSLSGGFVLDDKQLIVTNPIVHSLANISRAFTTHFLYGYADTQSLYYRPLVTVSYQLNYALAGDSALPYRISNVLLSLIAALLVFAIARRITGQTTVAGLAGVLFAVLPSHAESVAWISGRTDLLAAVFGLTAFLVFLRAVDRARPGVTGLIGCSILLACAMFSKESAVVVPALFLLYLWVFGRKAGSLGTWLAALLIPVLVYLLARHFVLGAVLSGPGVGHMLGPRMARLGYVYTTYLRMLLVPTELQVYYGEPGKAAASALQLVQWLVPLALVAAAVLCRRKQPLLAFCAGWVLISLAPSADLVYTTTLLPAERFVYLASVGSSVFLAWLIWRAYQWRPQAARMLPALIIIAAAGYVLRSAALTVYDASVYTSEVAWARRVAETAPPHKLLRLTAAQAFLDADKPEEALAQLEAVLTLASDKLPPRDRAALEYRLADLYNQFGDPDKARRALERARHDDRPR